MPDATAPTPFADPPPGRRPDAPPWRQSLRDAGLPAGAADVIGRVVRRTRLWRREQDAVAAELIAHFHDALAGGATPAEALVDFGDPRAVARLGPAIGWDAIDGPATWGGRVCAAVEHYLGRRDGTVTAIALERFRGRHGEYPTTLDALVPDFMPSVPPDRITGDPIRYALVDGQPLLYSVGVDRVDDGGRAADRPRQLGPVETVAAVWPAVGDERASPAARGDWILYSAAPLRLLGR